MARSPVVVIGSPPWEHVGMGYDNVAARTFVYANARLLEQRLYEILFDGADPGSIVTAVAPYQNADGGFGNGLEPDKRAPASQALDVEVAFERLALANATAPNLTTPACDWLATIAEPSGAVPILLPSIADYPRAAHWTPTSYPAGLNPTAGIVGRATALGVQHEWVERAGNYCLAELESGNVPSEGHELVGLCKLVANASDQDRAIRAGELLSAAIPTASFMRLDPDSDDYGVTPLEFAPTPDSGARSWFDDAIVEGHLDRLERDQQEDGGWPIAWAAPSPAATLAWRGIRTVFALRTLNAYGRTGA